MDMPAKALRPSKHSVLRFLPNHRTYAPRILYSRLCSLHPVCHTFSAAIHGKPSHSFHSSRLRRIRYSHASISHEDWKHIVLQVSPPELRSISGRSLNLGRHYGAARIYDAFHQNPYVPPPDIFLPSRPEPLRWKSQERYRNPPHSASR